MDEDTNAASPRPIGAVGRSKSNDADAYSPIPPYLRQQVQTLAHDLVRARQNLQSGRLKPEHFAPLERELNARILRLEALVKGRLDAERAGWRPPKTGAS
jgi:hypothetical protein